MRILTALTYYRPYTSGLTIYAERLARALAVRGHEVTVLAMRHDASLPREEVLDGVRVVRTRVLFAAGKGLVSAEMSLEAARLAASHDALILHLPQFDAPMLALAGRARRIPVVLTYHCDLVLPPGIGNRCVNAVVNAMHRAAAPLAHRVVAYTDDYAMHSPFLRAVRTKLAIIAPPVDLPACTPDEVAAFRTRHDLHERRPRIAMAARFAAEKGIDVLLDAMQRLRERHPGISVVFAGPHENVPGEAAYLARLAPRIRLLEGEGRWRFLGIVSQAEMSALFRSVDVLAVPSLNATESFGLVQIEAMMNGLPVVASDLPGVRQPIAVTGMGAICAAGDPRGLADALDQVLSGRYSATMTAEGIRARFSPENTAMEYEKLIAPRGC